MWFCQLHKSLQNMVIKDLCTRYFCTAQLTHMYTWRIEFSNTLVNFLKTTSFVFYCFNLLVRICFLLESTETSNYSYRRHAADGGRSIRLRYLSKSSNATVYSDQLQVKVLHVLCVKSELAKSLVAGK